MRWASSRRSGLKGKAVEEGEENSKYRSTVILPQTSFDQRANAVVREPEIQKWWEEHRVYEKLAEDNKGELFVLHDGPPYANGDLHMGHALNKILKDFINRYQMLKGRRVRYIPGWDCHGLPIELKVIQSLKSEERDSMTPLQLRKKAATFAEEAVDKQRTSFKRFGVWGEWEKPYLTLQREYEAKQIEVFGQMVLNGHIYRGFKPVHWSPSSRTALAEAELEYPENHVSRSIYVGFDVCEVSQALQAAGVSPEGLRVAIWTTTPWTIPANLAVAVNENIQYTVVAHPSDNHRYIVAQDLIPSFAKKVLRRPAEEMQVLGTFRGAQLVGTKYSHPLYGRVSEIVVGGDYITTESGTGLVHTAPGHGQDDYLTGLKYNLPLLSPVDDAGRFTEEAGEHLKGLSVLKEGNEAVIGALNQTGTLLQEEAYNHKYPYDWRTKKPVGAIFVCMSYV
jgi:isoleucyl-tRNA synthetase